LGHISSSAGKLNLPSRKLNRCTVVLVNKFSTFVVSPLASSSYIPSMLLALNLYFWGAFRLLWVLLCKLNKHKPENLDAQLS